MAEVERIINAPIDRIWAVLADGWSYPNWVVGNAHVRNVDAQWPEPGSRLHHNSGCWPVTISDITVVRRCEPPNLLVMQPRLWPLGRGLVTIRLTSLDNQRTRVYLAEDFDRGPLRWALVKVNDILLHKRNAEGLRRLSDVATGQHRQLTGQQPRV